MTKISAIVLAAGLSTRMEGGRKLFLEYGSRTIVGEVLHQLSQSTAYEVIVVGSELSVKGLEEIISEQGIECCLVLNEQYKMGMTTSIQTGVQAAHTGADGFMICLADMPKIDSATYNEIVNSFTQHYQIDSKSIVLPFFQEEKGNPVIFSSLYKEEILGHQEMEGCKGVIEKHQSHLSKVNVDLDSILLDIDTKENYLNIRA